MTCFDTVKCHNATNWSEIYHILPITSTYLTLLSYTCIEVTVPHHLSSNLAYKNVKFDE